MTEVRAEITGNVWQVHIREGQEVAVGETLVVLESMKMEIPVESPAAGIVRSVAVKPEDRVAEGDLLAIVDE